MGARGVWRLTPPRAAGSPSALRLRSHTGSGGERRGDAPDRLLRPGGEEEVHRSIRGPDSGLAVAFTCDGICAPAGLTGERLAIRGSTARLIPSLRSGSRNASRLPPARGRRCLAPGVDLRWTARSVTSQNLVALRSAASAT